MGHKICALLAWAMVALACVRSRAGVPDVIGEDEQ